MAVAFLHNKQFFDTLRTCVADTSVPSSNTLNAVMEYFVVLLLLLNTLSQ